LKKKCLNFDVWIVEKNDVELVVGTNGGMNI
jgi:hypothetical protein